MRSLVVLSFVLVAQLAFAQTSEKPALSASAKSYLHNLAKSDSDLPANPTNYVFNRGNEGHIYTSTLIKVNDDINEEALTQLGAQVGTKAGDVWTVKVPIAKVTEFVEFAGISFIEMDQPIGAMMDSARAKTNVDLVHAGTGLPQAYTGAGVVVGIIDYGFDYTHPNFYDASLTNYRVKRVWEQKNTSGTNPDLFDFGSEFADSLSIVTQGHDASENTSHGTHVGGIAGGSGAGSADPDVFKGMAPESDLVFVAIDTDDELWLSTGKADFVDGVNYIFDYATSVGKPAVVNISWGGYVGPRDGTGLFSQAINNLTGSGKVLVKSAGNSGGDNLHLYREFSPEDSLVKSFVKFNNNLPYKYTNMDLWGEEGETFCIKFSLHIGPNEIAISEMYCLDNEVSEIELVNNNGDICSITLTTEVAQSSNDKPHMFLEISNDASENLLVHISATSGSIHGWQGHVTNNRGYASEFENNSFSWATDGDEEYLTGDMASTHGTIVVGSYNSKLSYTNLSGQLINYAPTGYSIDELTLFSSHGPTADGRLKPEITAPGIWVASSVGSYDESYMPGGNSYNVVVSEYTSPLNSEEYRFALSAGTSMSSPCVAGIVALMLEQNPTLWPYQVREVLQNTAIVDEFTGPIPAEGDYGWGWGKVNAHAAMLYVLEGVGIYHHEAGLNLLLYPNPVQDLYNINYESGGNEMLTINVVDINGRTVSTDSWQVTTGANTRTFDMSGLPAGIYMVNVVGEVGVGSVKVVKG